MLPKNTTRTEITQDAIETLVSEKNRTGLGPSAIFRYTKSLGLLDATSALKSGMITAWLSGTSTSAYNEDIKAVLDAYQSIGFEVEVPQGADDRRLIMISDGVNAELQSFLSNRTVSIRKLMVSDAQTPKGLTEHKLRRLAEGREHLVLLSHLKFIRKAMKKWAESKR